MHSPTLLRPYGVQGRNRGWWTPSEPWGGPGTPCFPALPHVSTSPNLSLSPSLGVFLATKKGYQSLAPGDRGRTGKGPKRLQDAAGLGGPGAGWTAVMGMKAQAGQAGPATHMVILQMTPLWPWLSPA